MKSRPILGLLLIGIFVLSACAAPPTATPLDANAIYTAAAQTMQAQNPAITETPAAAQPMTTGSISGAIDNPMTEGFQTMMVVAYNASNYPNGGYYTAFIQSSQEDYSWKYSITLPGGDYFVVVYILDGNGKFTGPIGGYTNAVTCGLTANCTDHGLTRASVANGAATTNINPNDFTGMASAFPPMPESVIEGGAVQFPTTAPGTSTDCGDLAKFETDVSIKDGTVIKSGTSFDKIWRLKNTGACTWDDNYSIQYENGQLQPAVIKLPLTSGETVAPGQTVDVKATFNVNLTPGTYRSNWSLRNPSGSIVPFSNISGNLFWAEIKVKNASDSGNTTTAALQSLSDCSTIRDNVARAIPYRWTMIDEPYTDSLSGASGMVCHIEADGSGVDFGSLGIDGIVTAIQSSLNGWSTDLSRQAAGAGEIQMGYARGSATLVVNVSMEASSDANCPSDQPISACVLTPEQEMYTIILRGWQ